MSCWATSFRVPLVYPTLQKNERIAAPGVSQIRFGPRRAPKGNRTRVRSKTPRHAGGVARQRIAESNQSGYPPRNANARPGGRERTKISRAHRPARDHRRGPAVGRAIRTGGRGALHARQQDAWRRGRRVFPRRARKRARSADFQPGEFVAKVSVYIDGFNLYYGALKGTPYKWLDLTRLCQALLPSDTIQEIKYFTARVSARPSKPTSAHDQGLLHSSAPDTSESHDQIRSFPNAHGPDVSGDGHSSSKSLGRKNRREGIRCQPRVTSRSRRFPQAIRGGGANNERFRHRRAGTNSRSRTAHASRNS